MCGIVHLEHHKETVELRFRKRECTLGFHRVLCSYDHEGRRKIICPVIHGNLPLGHGFEKCCLSLGRCPVDLIREKDLVHHRTFPVFKLSRLHIKNRHSCHIRRKRIGSKLYASEIKINRSGKGLHKSSLAYAGDILYKYMSSCKKADENILGHIALTYEIFVYDLS